MPGNAAAWELLQAGATQLRMSGMGGPVGFDYNALALVAEAFGIDLTPGMWRKVQAVETDGFGHPQDFMFCGLFHEDG